MASTILSKNRYLLIFLLCALTLAAVQLQALLWLGLTLQYSIIDSAVSTLTLVLACIAVATGFRFYFPEQNRIIYFIFWCLALSGISLLTEHFIFSWLLSDRSELALIHKSLLVRFTISFLIIGWMAMLTVLWSQQEQKQEEEKRKTDAEKLSRNAELARLRQQLQPHFLFNSLNSINALISSRQEEAKSMVLKLSEFLRATIRNEDQWLSLENEMHHLQLYLDIEKVRFGHRLLTTIFFDERCAALRLPALMLQPIVENAIKFGLYDTTGEVTISIQASCEQNVLKITVQNPFDGAQAAAGTGTGFGLSSVQRRLYLLFGRNDLLITSVNGDLFTTSVSIPQPSENPMHLSSN